MVSKELNYLNLQTAERKLLTHTSEKYLYSPSVKKFLQMLTFPFVVPLKTSLKTFVINIWIYIWKYLIVGSIVFREEFCTKTKVFTLWPSLTTWSIYVIVKFCTYISVLYFMYLLCVVCGYVHVKACMWNSEENLWESAFYFYHIWIWK